MTLARLVLATSNAGKVRELRGLVAEWGPIEVLSLPQVLPLEMPEETGDTYLENALLKARAVVAVSGLPALADDSGIEVDALGGKPGPRSARFAGDTATDDENLRAMIQAIAGVPAGGRSARYRCVAAVAWPDGRAVHAEGTCEGSLIGKPRGAGGFGYDPIFVPVGWDETIAELSPEQKDRISHRGRAFRALREVLESSTEPIRP